ncbi:hypothetical protein [Desertihabitans aurantiacus]|nr:hypothetical protein [Desertihabitans aurantiacus]
MVTVGMVEEIQRQHARLSAKIEELHAAKDQLDGILAEVRAEVATH